MGDFSAGYAGGYAKGMLSDIQAKQNQQKLNLAAQGLAQDQYNKDISNHIAMQDLGIRQEDLNMRKAVFNSEMDEKERQKQIDAGLGSALKDGGYTAGIEFLKTADPQKAIAFHSAKLTLDKQIMENDVMQAQVPRDQQKAMYETYGLMASFGAGIEKMPPEERGRAWKLALPMIRKTWPKAPEEYNADAQTAMKLAIAQGTPENILFNSQKMELSAKSKTAKIGADIESRIKAGLTPETDPTLQALMKEQKAAEGKAQEANLQILDTQMAMAKKEQDASETFNKTLEKASGDFIKTFDSYTQAKAHIDSLKQDPTNPYKQSVLQRMFIKSINSGAMSIADEALGDSATGLEGLNKKLGGLLSGEKVNLSAKEMKALASAWETSMQGKLNKQLAVEAEYKKSGQNYSNIKWEAVRFPSKSYFSFLESQKEQNMYGQVIGKLPKEMQGQVQQELEQLRGNPQKLEKYMANIQKFLQSQQNPQQMEQPVNGQ